MRQSPMNGTNYAEIVARGRPAGDGGPSSVTTRRTLPPWTCSLVQLSASTCSMPSSSWAGPQRPRLDQRHSNSDDRMVARQITEAFPWNEAPHYLIRDRDRIYGSVVTRRLRAMGIRDRAITPASPWQNAFAERLIGSIRRECVDHVIVLGEANLRRVLKSYADYYNNFRTHRSLNNDAPVSHPVQRIGSIKSHAILAGLHHHYARA
jgi:Integrase core domain